MTRKSWYYDTEAKSGLRRLTAQIARSTRYIKHTHKNQGTTQQRLYAIALQEFAFGFVLELLDGLQRLGPGYVRVHVYVSMYLCMCIFSLSGAPRWAAAVETCMCESAHVYVCMYVCIFNLSGGTKMAAVVGIWVCESACECIYVFLVYLEIEKWHTCIHTCIHTHMHTYLQTYENIHDSDLTHIQTYMRIHRHT